MPTDPSAVRLPALVCASAQSRRRHPFRRPSARPAPGSAGHAPRKDKPEIGLTWLNADLRLGRAAHPSHRRPRMDALHWVASSGRVGHQPHEHPRPKRPEWIASPLARIEDDEQRPRDVENGRGTLHCLLSSYPLPFTADSGQKGKLCAPPMLSRSPRVSPELDTDCQNGTSAARTPIRRMDGGRGSVTANSDFSAIARVRAIRP